MNHVLVLQGCLAVSVGAVLGRAGTARAVRRLRVRLAEVEYRASHDPLTGLLNRAGLHDRFSAARRQQLLVLVDIDGFKAINDRFGHPMGDVLLTSFATRLAAAAARLGGIAGRLGGDEFVLLFHSGATAGITDGLLAELSGSTPLPGLDAVPLLSASAGITAVTPTMSWSDALRQADIALYHAKAGEQAITCFEPNMTHPEPGQAPPPSKP